MLHTTAAIALTTVAVAGCVYLPHTTNVYAAGCEIDAKKMTLEAHQIASLGHCVNEGCAALLVVAGIVGAATAVVSGSIVVAGNVVYWLEKKGQCMNENGNNN
jgi:hypothetical protein